MNEPHEHNRPTAGRGRRKFLALIGATSFLGAALYLSQGSLSPAPVVAADDPTNKDPSANAVLTAKTFLDSLDAKLRDKAQYEFGSSKKPNWSNLPASVVARNGVRLGDLTKEQRDKALAVVASVLSRAGYQKVIDIMDGDQQLAEGKGGGKGPKGGGKDGKVMFGKDLYYLAIFGSPSETKPWMVQFGGHHLGVNVTIAGKNFILTPTHTGAQPALFKRGDTEVRPLGRESDAAYKLMDSLDEKQKGQAVISERLAQLQLGPGQDGKKLEPKGIKGSALNKTQQGLLLDVIGAWVDIVESGSSRERMAAIQEKLGETYFAWSGPVEKGKAAYFRIQGPTIVIEYAPQGNTDHIHTVIRHPDDDYGVGTLKNN